LVVLAAQGFHLLLPEVPLVVLVVAAVVDISPLVELLLMAVALALTIMLLEATAQPIQVAVVVVVEQHLLVKAAPVLSLSKSLTLSLPHSLVVSHLLSQLLCRDSTSIR
jgi:hypothetical protein